VLQHTTPHCNTLHYNATHCNILQHTATHCYTLLHTATHCITLPHTVIHCNTLPHIAIHRRLMINNQHAHRGSSVLKHIATHCNTLQCIVILYTGVECAASHCKWLQTHCDALHKEVRACFITMQHTATHCNVLKHEDEHTDRASSLDTSLVKFSCNYLSMNSWKETFKYLKRDL